ncbi:MAG TPA: hypothetical protein VFE36_05010 [Candidatus Baltobacteraceae bacterium]|nr:hypothetical protein [Candidatus Baltobacteraceae bacterium]
MYADAAQAARVAIIAYAENATRVGIPPIVEPVAVVDDYALADWNAGPKEGEALLVMRNGKWHVVAFENSSIADAHFLTVRYKVPEPEAAALVKTLLELEKRENIRP